MAKQTPHQKAWSTRRANLKKAAVKKLTAHQKAWATRRANTTVVAPQPAKKAAKLTPSQKAWITRKANNAKADVYVAKFTPKPAAPTTKWKCWAGPVVQVKQKTVRGIIKAGQPTVAELAGNFNTPSPVYVAPVPITPYYNTVLALYKGRPDRWIKGRSATSLTGGSVTVTSKEAAKFCLSAAIERIYAHNAAAWSTARNKVNDVIRGYSLSTIFDVISFNDKATTTFDDILRVVTIAGI